MPEWFTNRSGNQINADAIAAANAMGEQLPIKPEMDISGRVEKQNNTAKVWDSLNDEQRNQFRKGLKVNGLDQALYQAGTDMQSLRDYAKKADERAATEQYVAEAEAQYSGANAADKELIDRYTKALAAGPSMSYNEKGQLVDDASNIDFATLDAMKRELMAKGYSEEMLKHRVQMEAAEITRQENEYLKGKVNEGTGSAAMLNAASVPLSAIGNAVAAADLAGQAISRKVTGSAAPIYTESRNQSASLGMEAVRGQTAENIQQGTQQAINNWAAGMPEDSKAKKALQDHAEEIGNVMSFMYQTGMSGADSLAAAGLGPAGAIILGTGAGVANMRDALNNGATIGEAAAYGVTTAAFESIFESMSISQLKSFKKLEELKPAEWKDFAKKVIGSVTTNFLKKQTPKLRMIWQIM